MDDKNTKNRRSNSIVITKDQYNNLLEMLKSGEEDKVLAMNCIKALSLKDNIIPIALLLKHSGIANHNLWIKNCPKHIKTLQSKLSDSIDAPLRGFTYEKIYKMILTDKINSKEHISIFIEDVANFFKNTMIKFDFIENVNIDIKIKDYE